MALNWNWDNKIGELQIVYKDEYGKLQWNGLL